MQLFRVEYLLTQIANCYRGCSWLLIHLGIFLLLLLERLLQLAAVLVYYFDSHPYHVDQDHVPETGDGIGEYGDSRADPPVGLIKDIVADCELNEIEEDQTQFTYDCRDYEENR